MLARSVVGRYERMSIKISSGMLSRLAMMSAELLMVVTVLLRWAMVLVLTGCLGVTQLHVVL